MENEIDREHADELNTIYEDINKKTEEEVEELNKNRLKKLQDDGKLVRKDLVVSFQRILGTHAHAQTWWWLIKEYWVPMLMLKPGGGSSKNIGYPCSLSPSHPEGSFIRSFDIFWFLGKTEKKGEKIMKIKIKG